MHDSKMPDSVLLGSTLNKTIVITLLARQWDAARGEAFWQSARQAGMAIEPGPVETLPGTSLTMQRARATGEPSPEARATLRLAAEHDGLDVFAESEELFHTPRRLFAFDMDSTLIQAEVVDELAALAGVKPQVSAITESAMRGEIDFPTSLTRRVGLLKGIPAEKLDGLRQTIRLGDGLEGLMAGLKAKGCRTAILSGGFTFFGSYLQERLGFDYLCANELEIADGMLTGRLASVIVDGARKAQELKNFAEREGIPLAMAVAAGDGANDLPMLAVAGTGVAYHAKPVVRAAAAFRVQHCGLDGLLHFLHR